jgi:hypothetical protein
VATAGIAVIEAAAAWHRAAACAAACAMLVEFSITAGAVVLPITWPLCCCVRIVFEAAVEPVLAVPYHCEYEL